MSGVFSFPPLVLTKLCVRLSPAGSVRVAVFVVMAVELSVTVKAFGLGGPHSCHAGRADGVESDMQPERFITQMNVQSYRVIPLNG